MASISEWRPSNPVELPSLVPERQHRAERCRLVLSPTHSAASGRLRACGCGLLPSGPASGSPSFPSSIADFLPSRRTHLPLLVRLRLALGFLLHRRPPLALSSRNPPAGSGAHGTFLRSRPIRCNSWTAWTAMPQPRPNPGNSRLDLCDLRFISDQCHC